MAKQLVVRTTDRTDRNLKARKALRDAFRRAVQTATRGPKPMCEALCAGK